MIDELSQLPDFDIRNHRYEFEYLFNINRKPKNARLPAYLMMNARVHASLD